MSTGDHLERKPSLTVIGGHPRSGTSSLRRILNRHPDAYCTNELPLKLVYPAFAKSLQAAHERAASSEWDQRLQDRIARMVAESWFALSKFEEERSDFVSAASIANKTPGSERYFEVYEQAIPDARFIYCFRDPAKVVRSNLNMPWSGGSLEHAMNRLRAGYEFFLSARETLGERLLVFRIEDFASDPYSVCSELCAHIGVPADDVHVEAMASTKPANTLQRYESKGESKGLELSATEEELVRSDPIVRRAVTACRGPQALGASDG